MFLQIINSIIKPAEKSGEQTGSGLHVKPKNHIKPINRKMPSYKNSKGF